MEQSVFYESIAMEWEHETGFFERLRSKKFSHAAFDRLLNTLRGFRFSGEPIEFDLVSKLWYIPIFMEWQTENIIEDQLTLESYEIKKNQIMEQLESILGVP
jgi:hypothetical protein